MSDEEIKRTKVPIYTLGSADPRTIVGSTGSPKAKGYHAFSAVDVKVSIAQDIESTVIAEISQVSAIENLIEEKVTGSVIAIIFDRDPLRRWVGQTFDIVLRAVNEYGDRATSVIKNARFTSVHWGVSIDDVIMEVFYDFEAESCTGFLSPQK